ncbi:MAG: HEAT repeat domain-containing protein [Myxococcales bacterium]|nr:HEAT repeat domain-containing protein [Myxococcales bacterium]MCB9532061.1 HEAT repeat domain-containing protein [Myxococcales bacterium]
MLLRTMATLALLGAPFAASGCAGRGDDLRTLAVVESLEVRLASADRDVRLDAVRELARLGVPEASPMLAAALEDPDFRVRRDAVTGLGGLGAEARDQVGAIAALARDPAAIVRARAVAALGQIGGRGAAAELAKLLGDADTVAVEPIYIALGETGHVQAVDAVSPGLDSEDAAVRAAAVRALAALGELAIPALERGLDGAHSDVRCAAALGLAGASAVESLERIELAWSGDPAAPVRLCAAAAVAALDPSRAPRALAELSEALGDPALEDAAAAALASLATPDAAELLVAALGAREYDRERADPVFAAVVALGEGALPALEAARRHAPVSPAALEEAVARIEFAHGTRR